MIRLIILGVVFGIAGAILARKKGRSPILWFILCTLIIPVIAIALLPSVVAKGVTKKCPYCAEIIKEDATVCKYCGVGNL